MPLAAPPAEGEDRVTVYAGCVYEPRDARARTYSDFSGLLAQESDLMRLEAGDSPADQEAWRNNRLTTLSRMLYRLNHL